MVRIKAKIPEAHKPNNRFHLDISYVNKLIMFLMVIILFPFVSSCSASNSVTTLPETTKKIELTQPTINIELTKAKQYQILDEGNVVNGKMDRTVGLWFIYSEEADSFEEYAQTAIQAVQDLYKMYGRDSTSVLLVASDKARVPYAQASYAADGLGALGMTGSAPAVPMYWMVRAADRQLTQREMAIAELWSQHQADFPSTNPLSSSFYDEEALRRFIADELQIPYSEVKPLLLPTKVYLSDTLLNN
jgi:hypothetical protein